MKQRILGPSRLLGLGLGALAGLALLIETGPSSTAFAAGNDSSREALVQARTTAQTGSQAIAGNYLSLPPDQYCTSEGVTLLCHYTLKGVSVGNDGEVYQHTILGTAQGAVEKPGDVRQGQSYVTWAFDDGSSLLLKSQGITTVDESGKLKFDGSQTCLEGTGRFAQVDCDMDWSNREQDNGVLAGTYSGTMTPRAHS